MGDVFSSGSSRPATTEELASYERMRQSLSQLPVPVLQRRDNPHEYLFFALFDGTGQDANNPDGGPLTNVGVLKEQADKLERTPGSRIASHYVEGIGTQDNPMTRIADQALAFSWDERIKKMYREFANQAKKWVDADPQAQIRIAEVGYSRGAVLVPGFARLVDQYGIADPEYLEFSRDQHGNLTLETTRPPLVPPGQVAQVAGLLDPVAANFPQHYDARPPSSVISGFSIRAESEQRQWFPHQTIIDQQMTADGRFLGVTVPGGHANIGGGNRQNGLEILNGNAMADYLNALSNRPLFEKRPVPTDPAMMTVSQVQGMTGGFGTRMDRDGQRDLREALANCKIVDPCRDSEPLDTTLSRQFPRRFVGAEPAQRQPAEPQASQSQAPVPSPPHSITASQALPDPTHNVRDPQPPPAAAPQAQASAPVIPEHLRDFRHQGHSQPRPESVALQPAPAMLRPTAPEVAQAAATTVQAALHPGDRGPEVWTLQDALIRSGVNQSLPNPVQAHGAYDQATQHGVMAFQLQQGLEPTGIADAVTRQTVQQGVRAVEHAQAGPSLTPTDYTASTPPVQQAPTPAAPAPEAPTAAVDAHWQQQLVREQQERMLAQARHEEDNKRREEEPTRQASDPLAAASSQMSKPLSIEDHPALPGIRQALCDKLEQQGQLAGVSDDRLTEIAGQLHRSGLQADGRWAASIRNDTFFAQGQELAKSGAQVKLDLSQPEPSAEQTLQKVATYDQDQARDAQARQEQRQREQDDPGRKPTM